MALVPTTRPASARISAAALLLVYHGHETMHLLISFLARGAFASSSVSAGGTRPSGRVELR